MSKECNKKFESNKNDEKFLKSRSGFSWEKEEDLVLELEKDTVGTIVRMYLVAHQWTSNSEIKPPTNHECYTKCSNIDVTLLRTRKVTFHFNRNVDDKKQQRIKPSWR